MMHHLPIRCLAACIGLLASLAGCGAPDAPPEERSAALVPADTSVVAMVGETLFVPVYSHIFTQDGTRELDLTVTVSLRNTDPEHALTVWEVDYYDSAGQLVRRYAESPFRLAPMTSDAFVVGQRDRTGGVGANFLVRWTAADGGISAPIAEAVMVSTEGGQGVSLVSRGYAVRSLGDQDLPTSAPAP